MKKNRLITSERLRELMRYDPATGLFVRLKMSGGKPAGSAVGWLENSGHVRISIDGVKYLAHVLAWLYMMGEWPAHEVDHWDLNKENNVWDNLRPATRSQNAANTKARSNNKLGLKGVSWNRRDKVWQANITVNGKIRSVARLDCPAAAHFAYAIESDKAFGEFARMS